MKWEAKTLAYKLDLRASKFVSSNLAFFIPLLCIYLYIYIHRQEGICNGDIISVGTNTFMYGQSSLRV